MRTFDLRDLEELGYGTVESLRAMIRNGELKAFSANRKAGAKKPRYRVTEESLREFVERRSVGPAPVVSATRRRRSRKAEVTEFYK